MNRECVQCGYCCLKSPCSYGKTDKNGRCIFLIDEDKEIGTFSCCIKKEIDVKEANFQYPMFGSGCSSSLFNTTREAVIKKENERSRV